MDRLKKIILILIHSFVWIVFAALPIFLSSDQDSAPPNWIKYYWVILISYSFVFYINYFILIKKFLFEKKKFQFIIINVLLVFSVVFASNQITNKIREDYHEQRKIETKNKGTFEPKNHRKKQGKLFFIFDCFGFLLPIAFSIAIRTTDKWNKLDREKKELTNAKLQSELEHLKYQLQPHFFFNSLNNVYSLIDISPEKAKEMVYKLSKLMRYLLYESNIEKANILKEIEFMKNYIDLMKIRTSDNMVIEEDFININSNTEIAPLIYISLIENAFKHGISASESTVLYFGLNQKENELTFISKNKNLPKSHITDKSQSGIGLDNVRKRLNLIYPNKHIFTTEIINNDFVATIKIDLK